MDAGSGYLSRQQEVLRQVSLLALIGLGLFGIVFFAPNADPYQGTFFQAALESRWGKLGEFPAVWSSIKIILFSIGLFLVIESVGTVLAVLKLRSLAVPVFFLQVLPCLCLCLGGYYLIKSLL